jgi:hypothetical protein
MAKAPGVADADGCAVLHAKVTMAAGCGHIPARQRHRGLSFVPRQRNLNLRIALSKEDFS